MMGSSPNQTRYPLAAHAATIFIQVLANVDSQVFLSRAKSCLGACGIDATLGFSFEYGADYSALYDACHDGDAAKARWVMETMLKVIDPVLRHYASMEEFTRVKMEYWKPHTAWCNKRYADFHDPAAVDHSKLGTGAPYTDKGQSRYAAIAAGKA
jgi:hypothetical protein